MFITVHTHTHTQTEMYKHGVSRLQSKTTRNTRIVEQIQFVICCREGEFVPWKIMSLTKRVLEGRFGGFGIWLGDLGGGVKGSKNYFQTGCCWKVGQFMMGYLREPYLQGGEARRRRRPYAVKK